MKDFWVSQKIIKLKQNILLMEEKLGVRLFFTTSERGEAQLTRMHLIAAIGKPSKHFISNPKIIAALQAAGIRLGAEFGHMECMYYPKTHNLEFNEHYPYPLIDEKNEIPDPRFTKSGLAVIARARLLEVLATKHPTIKYVRGSPSDTLMEHLEREGLTRHEISTQVSFQRLRAATRASIKNYLTRARSARSPRKP